MKRWLGRLAFSFMIIGGVLAWEGQKRGGPMNYYIPAMIFIVLGAAGLRERHRPTQ
jgi:hypothetical protein